MTDVIIEAQIAVPAQQMRMRTAHSLGRENSAAPAQL